MYRLFLALRYLRSRLVNLISIGGVMAGVAVLIVVVSIMDGFQDRVRTAVRGSLSHIILTPTTAPDELIEFTKLEEALRKERHVEAAAPLVNLPVFYEYETAKVTAVGHEGLAWHQMEALGIDYKRERKVTELRSYLLAATDMENPFYHPVAAEREKVTVLVSRTFAENFYLGQYDAEGTRVRPQGALRDERGTPFENDADVIAGCKKLIGSELRIMWGAAERTAGGDRRITTNSKNLIISGVYDALDSVEDNRKLYFDIAQVRRMGNIAHEYLQARVRLDDYENAKELKEELATQFEQTFIVETWEDQRADFLRAVNNEKVLLVIVLSFIILLGGFVILATLTLTVVEKTRDIGIVAALGATKRGILSIFVWNGMLIGIIGSILGLGLGYWFTANVNWVKDRLSDMGVDIFPPNIYHFDQVPTIWHWPTVFIIMAGAVIVAFIAGLLPALRAARLDPIAALRYE